MEFEITPLLMTQLGVMNLQNIKHLFPFQKKPGNKIYLLAWVKYTLDGFYIRITPSKHKKTPNPGDEVGLG